MLTIKKQGRWKGEIWSYFTKGEKLNSSHYKAKCMYCNLSVCGINKIMCNWNVLKFCCLSKICEIYKFVFKYLIDNPFKISRFFKFLILIFGDKLHIKMICIFKSGWNKNIVKIVKKIFFLTKPLFVLIVKCL